MAEGWVCTKCGAVSVEPQTKLLDGNYGTQRCGSTVCKRGKRIFHREELDANGRPRLEGGERPHAT